MNKNIYVVALLYIGLCITACNDNADVNIPTGSMTPPSQVLNVSIKNKSGAAVIYYDLPDDQNLKYVRASYKVNNTIRTVNASFYTDSLVVDGFPSEGEYDIELYSVSYGEVVSAPLVVRVSPETPPYQTVRKTLEVAETFGGIKVSFENRGKAKLSLGVLKKEENGNWNQIFMHYTEAEDGSFYVRGLNAVPSEFGFLVRDRWGHISDTLCVIETPLFEEQCNKILFRKHILPTDTYECHKWNTVTQGNDMTKLWDGITGADPLFHTKTNTSMPQWFTFDMGETYRLSRFLMHARWYQSDETFTFKGGHPKKFEVWGSNNPNPDGSFDGSWVLLSAYESIRPSGGGLKDPLTAEDRQLAKNGEDFAIPDEAPSVRYIRFKTNETWGFYKYMFLQELTFFGAKNQ